MASAPPVTGVAAVAARGTTWRDVAASLSFANLCYLRIWSELLTYSGSDAYTMRMPFSRACYLAVMINVIVVSAAGWAAATLVRRSDSARLGILARLVFFALLLLPANALRSVLANHYAYLRSPLFDLLGTRGVLLLGLGLATVAALVVWRWPRQLAQIATATLLVLFPLMPMTFAQAIWRAAKYDPAAYRNGPNAPMLAAANSSPRVVWVILDEWDQRLTFANRPAGLRLPEIDRLRGESLYADNAYSPGPETPVSMPALITGRMVTQVIKRGPRELLLVHPDGKKPVPWGGEPNIFGVARAAGFNTALVGWYHPYCRIIEANLSECEWWEMSMQYNTMGRTLAELVPNQTRSLFETSLMSLLGQSLSTREHARTYIEMMDRTRQVVADPRYSLTLVHLPIPHAPHSYNRRTGRFDLKNAPIKGYVDSLALADLTVGEIRRTLEKAGLWEKTTVLLTTDHSYRAAEALDGEKDHRIPFLLKMPGRAGAVQLSSPFNTLLTHDLLLAVLRRELSTPAEAAAWIDAHRTIADSPYNNN